MAFVSVIVPVYNTGRYLRECLDSLIGQTLQEIEIICINDGSADNSPDILEEYRCKDPRIRVVSKENTGYGNTMNVGLELASGEYIGIVESDDFADKRMFEALYSCAKEHKADIVKSNYFEYKAGRDSLVENLKEGPFDELCSVSTQMELQKSAPSIWSAVYKKDFLLQNDIRFHETRGASYQDVSFSCITLALAERIVLVREAYLYYRCDNPQSSVKSRNKVYCICEEYEYIENFFKSRAGLWTALAGLVTYAKYRNYMWNYERLVDIYKKEFLHRLKAEFSEHIKKGEIEQTYWKEKEWETVQIILKDMDQYLYQTREYRRELDQFKTMNLQIYAEAAFQRMAKEPELILYGAGVVGKLVQERLVQDYGYRGKIIFAATEKNAAAASISELAEEKKTTLVIVAAMEDKQNEMLETLDRLCYQNILRIDKRWISIIFNKAAGESAGRDAADE